MADDTREREAVFTREEVVSLVAAAEEFRTEFGPGLIGLAGRLNEVLRFSGADEFVLRERGET